MDIVFKKKIANSILLLAVMIFFCLCFKHWYQNTVVTEVAKTHKPQQLVVYHPPVPIEKTTDEYIYYDVELSNDLQEYTQDICKKYGVPFELALAVMHVESRYQTDAVNGQCVGLFQINLDYANAYYDALDINDIKEPKDNILSGIWYLSELMNKHDDLNLVLMHYNLGNQADKLWNEGIHNTSYTQRVIAAELNLKLMEEY